MATDPPNTAPGEHGSGAITHSPASNALLQNRKNKKSSNTCQILRKLCSCCCNKAKRQRANLLRIDDPHPPLQNSLSDDDIISINGAEDTPQFQGPLPYATRRDSIDAPPAAVDQSQQNEDTTSEYEFPDLMSEETNRPERPTTLFNVSNHPTTSKHEFHMYNDKNAVVSRSKLQTMQPKGHSQFYPPRHLSHEPPPFPRQSGYNSRQQTLPHSQQRWQTYHRAPQSVSSIPVSQAPLRAARYNHYVSLQPSSYDTERTGRRDSFYDNSLPRDSPLFEYYQQLQQRQELPGTRNINQYFS